MIHGVDRRGHRCFERAGIAGHQLTDEMVHRRHLPPTDGGAVRDAEQTPGAQAGGDGVDDAGSKVVVDRVEHTVDDYQDFPIFAPYYSWDAWRWSRNRNVPASGTDTDVKWPDPQIGPHEREAGRSETFKVVFASKEGKAREWTPKDEGDFRRFSVDSKWTLEVDRLGVIHSVNPR